MAVQSSHNMSKLPDNDSIQLPTKILKKYIFKQLTGRELCKSRRVCKEWKEAIDSILKKEDKWRKYCKKEFKKVHKNAARNAPSLSWFNIYKSLCLWTKISEATMFPKLFTETSTADTISSFQIFDNKIGLHINDTVNYYDLKTAEKLDRRDYNDIFSKYRENDKIVAVINMYKSRLLFCPKEGEFNTEINFQEAFLEVEQDVTNFVLMDLNIYYVTEDNSINVCKITEDLKDAQKKFIKQFKGNVISLSYTNRLNILTDKYEIYSVIDNDFRLQYIYTTGPTLFNSLYEYNFFDNIVWSDVYRYIANNNLGSDSVGITWNISAIKSYGDIFLVGTVTGMLCIYNSPFVNGQLDLTMRPIKEYDLGEIARVEEAKMPMEMNLDEVSEEVRCHVSFIDVVEVENGHDIYVAMYGNLLKLQFKHDNKRSAEDQLSNDSKGKMLKK